MGFLKRQFAAVISIPAMLMILHLAFYIGIGTFNGDVRLPVPFARAEDSAIGPLGLWLVVQPIVAFGIMFMTTKVPEIVDEVFGIRPLAPRAGIGAGAIIGAPIGAMMFAGNVSRGASGIRSMAASYAYSGGVTGGIARTALRLPIIGNPQVRTQVGIAPDEEQEQFRQRAREERRRQGQPTPPPGDDQPT